MNKDMPAMPQPMVNHEGDVYTTFDNYSGKQSGLTKREMFAKDAMLAILSSKYINDFVKSGVGEEDQDCRMHEGVAIEALKYADALLKELEK